MRIILSLTLMAFCLFAQSVRAANDYGVIYSGQKDDRVFNSMVVDTINEFETAHDIRFRQRVIVTGEDSTAAIRAFVERGITTLVLVGYIHEQALRELAPLYPHARFTIIDGDVSGPNVQAIRFREHEAGFLAGMAAAYASRTGRVAFIGAVATPPVRRFGCGFIQGVRQARAVNIDFRYMTTDPDGFRDRRLARAVADEILAGGADVLFPAAGLASRDVLLAAANAGRMGIGVDSDQEEVAPGRIVTSALKRIDIAVASALKDLVSDTWQAGNREMGVVDGGVDWVREGADRFLTTDQITAIEAARKRIGAGSLKVAADEAGCDQSRPSP